jgi:septal ring factor EnvC (AmiA/AmiB activator)
MKPNPVTSLRDEDEAAVDAKSEASSPLHHLLRHAGLRVIDETRVVRPVQDAESPLNLAVFAPEAVDRTTAEPDEDTYRFLVTVAPATVGRAADRMPTLLGTFTEHLKRVERNCRRLQKRARVLESQAERQRVEQDRLRSAFDEERQGHRRSLEAFAAVREDLRRSEHERRQFEEQLARTTESLARCQLEQRFLRDDVVVKDAYLTTLREQAMLRQQSHADMRALTERLEDLTAEHAAEMTRAAGLAAANREICQQLDQAQQELHRVHAAIAATLAQPRYVVADRCNALARKVRLLHSAVKRVWAAWYRGR